MNKLTTRIAAAALACVFAVSTPIIMSGCSATSNGTGPVINAQTVEAIITLAASFYGFNGALTPQQITDIETFLTQPNPDVMQLIPILVEDGVIPPNKIVSTQQIDAIVVLLSALGFNPVINGTVPDAKYLVHHNN